MHISSVERLPITTTGSPLLVRTKTFHSVFFVIPRERDCHEMHQTLLRLSQPVHLDELYCFHYKCTPDDLPKSAGWNFFDIQTEYQRMNVPNEQWVLCTANKEYELCDTYPSEIYVPARASTTVLLGSARFRSRGRLPVLAYLHHNKAAIARCSQPLSGFSARCMEDEQMLDLIRRANPNCGYMYVVDTRPRINAMVNRAAGKGYENEAFYENIKFQFMGIENIHVMRKSLQKLVETCEQNSPTMSSFLNGLESSGWLKHIKSILDTSWWIASAIESGVSVCVHCSDGWDRTAQVCSLAALCLEPHYRTINGYQALIEKDWLSFGHKFTARCGHVACDSRERSPVFTQLLDCTWQLLRQAPEAFQFNERFLLTLHDHAHACQYGTFIGNCEKDRRDLRLSERTFSLWGYMASHLNEYKNPLYNPKAHPDVLKPDLNAQSIRFWRGMYCRHESGVHPRESLADLLPAAVEHAGALTLHIDYLAKRISTFKSLLSGRKAEKSRETTVVNYQNGTRDSVEIETKVEGLQIDNKLLYESGGNLSEMECANHDHPLKELGGTSPKTNKIPLITEKADATIPSSLAQLEAEMNTVALDWKSVKNVTECSCSTPLDYFSRKHHCWGCGRCVCTRCVCARAPLPALHAPRAVPLCAACAPSTPTDPPPAPGAYTTTYTHTRAACAPSTPTDPPPAPGAYTTTYTHTRAACAPSTPTDPPPAPGAYTTTYTHTRAACAPSTPTDPPPAPGAYTTTHTHTRAACAPSTPTDPPPAPGAYTTTYTHTRAACAPSTPTDPPPAPGAYTTTYTHTRAACAPATPTDPPPAPGAYTTTYTHTRAACAPSTPTDPPPAPGAYTTTYTHTRAACAPSTPTDPPPAPGAYTTTYTHTRAACAPSTPTDPLPAPGAYTTTHTHTRRLRAIHAHRPAARARNELTNALYDDDM
ncbi:myotubularin-related protein 6 [Melitaea cinxia]|uniref:myotubularin-related protein 6 n=1 Tax=Melitaea cinxia TaxID=113334 RepID=UPI001E274661|nr:myotubularin-related protein 6 [Melitaea cinxia]